MELIQPPPNPNPTKIPQHPWPWCPSQRNHNKVSCYMLYPIMPYPKNALEVKPRQKLPKTAKNCQEKVPKTAKTPNPRQLVASCLRGVCRSWRLVKTYGRCWAIAWCPKPGRSFASSMERRNLASLGKEGVLGEIDIRIILWYSCIMA